MSCKYLRIHRPTTGTTITVLAPFQVTTAITEQIACQLNGYVDHKYPGFEISDFWTEDQKKMGEVPLTPNK